jgi:HEAT repeat protein
MNREHNIKLAMQSNDNDLKIQSLNLLIENNSIDSDCIDFLVDGLKNPNRGVRDVSCRAILSLSDKDKDFACGFISELIEQSDIAIRNLAGEILIKMGDFSSSHLIPYLQNDDTDVRKYACDILGIVADNEALNPISVLLDDKDTNCINSAIEAIGNIFNRLRDSIILDPVILKKIFEIFDGGNEDLKPNIIDALGKIGGIESESFLLNIVRNNQDLFLKTAAIDSLAFTCNDLSICNMLMDEIDSYPEEIQSTLLKTIYAICYRTESMVKLPLKNRHIAYKALHDSDPDTRAAAIIAMGDTYIIEDVEALLHEFNNENYDIQVHILNNIFANSTGKVVDGFVTAYLNNLLTSDSFASEIELLSYIAQIWDSSDENNKNVFMERVLLFGFENLRGRDFEMLEFLNKLDKSIFNNKVIEIIEKNEDFKDYFEKLAQKLI